MPPRSAPSERQKRLGAELRRIRQAAGETTEFAARLLGVDRTKIANVETGVRTITPERLRTLAAHYGCRDERYVEALAAMGKPSAQGWWEMYRARVPAGLLDIAEMEWHAVSVRCGTFLHMPGLLQTDSYIRAVSTAFRPPLPEHEIELRIALRLQRQQILHRADPIAYTAFIHEAALHIEFGPTKVVRTQLRHLCEMSELPNVDVRVVPFSCGALPGAGQAMVYAEGVVSELDTVQLDTAHGPDFLHLPAQLNLYGSQLDWMEKASYSTSESQNFLLSLSTIR
ncbi:helix-turn-helix domain-containing protein [Streptomyces sp. NPDC049879]|uniref:helix-turn-helix domain-containing protein n=1 Tax=Streptomyces sp. NPDC049879 TaxID=3365598 RepID=UPI003788EF39